MMLRKMFFILPFLSTIAWGNCPGEEALIQNKCWTLNDSKLHLDGLGLSSLCMPGYKLPTKDDYASLQNAGEWKHLKIQTKEYYITSTVNDGGEHFFVSHYGVENGFFRKAKVDHDSSNLFVLARCFKPIESLSVEERVLATLEDASQAVIEKSDTDFEISYASLHDGSNSIDAKGIIQTVDGVNRAKSQLIHSLGKETKDLFDHIIEKAEVDQNGQMDRALIGTVALYERIQSESEKSVKADAQVKTLLSAHESSSIDIINSNKVTTENVTPETSLNVPGVKESLSSQNVSPLIKSYKGFVEVLLSTKTLNPNLLLNSSSAAQTSGHGTTEHSNGFALKVLPKLDVKKVEEINKKRKETDKIVLHKELNQQQVDIPFKSVPSAGDLVSSTVNNPQNEARLFTELDSNHISSTKEKAPDTNNESEFNKIVINKSTLKVERNDYLLASIHKKLFSSSQQEHAFEIVEQLKHLEDKISFSISSVDNTSLSSNEHRLKKDVSNLGVSSTSLYNHAMSYVNAFNLLKKLEKKIDSYPNLYITLELQYDEDSPKWRGANHIMKNKRQRMYESALGDLKMREKEDRLKVSSQSLNLFSNGKRLLSSLFRMADNPCPEGMTLNRTWQSRGASLQEVRSYICQGQDKKGYLLSFEKLPQMDKHLKNEKGSVILNLSQIHDDVSLSTGKCPLSTKTDIFGKELEVKFSGVTYEFEAKRMDDPRFFPQGVKEWRDSSYVSKVIKTPERKGTCIPNEEGNNYSSTNEPGKFISSPFNLCENNELIISERIQSDWISTKWKMGKVVKIECHYDFDYRP